MCNSVALRSYTPAVAFTRRLPNFSSSERWGEGGRRASIRGTTVVTKWSFTFFAAHFMYTRLGIYFFTARRVITGLRRRSGISLTKSYPPHVLAGVGLSKSIFLYLHRRHMPTIRSAPNLGFRGIRTLSIEG